MWRMYVFFTVISFNNSFIMMLSGTMLLFSWSIFLQKRRTSVDLWITNHLDACLSQDDLQNGLSMTSQHGNSLLCWLCFQERLTRPGLLRLLELLRRYLPLIEGKDERQDRWNGSDFSRMKACKKCIRALILIKKNSYFTQLLLKRQCRN